MTEGKQKFIIILLVINLIVVSYFGVTIKNKIEDTFWNIESQVQNVRTAVYNIDNEVKSAVSNALEQERNRVVEAEYDYQKIDSKAKKAVIYYSVKLKSVNANSKIFLAYNEENSTYCKEVEMKKINGLTYGVVVDLSLEKNYEYDIIERSDNGAEAVLNTRRYNCSLYDEFFEYRVMENNYGAGKSEDSANFHMYFSVNDFDLSDNAVDNVELKVYYDNKVIKQEDITDKVIVGADQEALEKYYIAVASGEIESTVSTEYVRNYKSENSNPNTYFYQLEIKYSDYPDLKLNMDEAEDLSINIIVTCKDGFTKDLWYGRDVVEEKFN